jgi:hypothetical protein
MLLTFSVSVTLTLALALALALVGAGTRAVPRPRGIRLGSPRQWNRVRGHVTNGFSFSFSLRVERGPTGVWVAVRLALALTCTIAREEGGRELSGSW